MNESDLYRLRLEPAPEFQRRLRMTLKSQEAQMPFEHGSAGRSIRTLAVTALAALVAAAMLMLTFPSVRAGTEALREFLRLGNCAAATIDRDRKLAA